MAQSAFGMQFFQWSAVPAPLVRTDSRLKRLLARDGIVQSEGTAIAIRLCLTNRSDEDPKAKGVREEWDRLSLSLLSRLLLLLAVL
jgi:hypothetical protein